MNQLKMFQLMKTRRCVHQFPSGKHFSAWCTFCCDMCCKSLTWFVITFYVHRQRQKAMMKRKQRQVMRRWGLIFILPLLFISRDLNISSLYCQSDISYKDSSKNLDFNQTLCLPTDIFLSSQTHSSWNCVDMVRQNLFLVTLSWSLRVNYNYNMLKQLKAKLYCVF